MSLLLWLVSGAAVILLLGFGRMFIAQYDFRLWPAIRRARKEIRKVARQRIPTAEVCSNQGATAISPGYLSFCIRTVTDKERDRLCQDPEIYEQFRNALTKAGYPSDTVPIVHFGVQSKETVDRDYGGSWAETSQM